MLKNFVKIFGGDPNKKVIEQYSGIARELNALEREFEALSDEALRTKTEEFRAEIARSLGNVEGLEEKELFKLQQDAKSQIPNNLQSPNSNDQNFWKLKIGAYLVIGAWDLVLIRCTASLNAFPLSL